MNCLTDTSRSWSEHNIVIVCVVQLALAAVVVFLFLWTVIYNIRQVTNSYTTISGYCASPQTSHEWFLPRCLVFMCSVIGATLSLVVVQSGESLQRPALAWVQAAACLSLAGVGFCPTYGDGVNKNVEFGGIFTSYRSIRASATVHMVCALSFMIGNMVCNTIYAWSVGVPFGGSGLAWYKAFTVINFVLFTSFIVLQGVFQMDTWYGWLQVYGSQAHEVYQRLNPGASDQHILQQDSKPLDPGMMQKGRNPGTSDGVENGPLSNMEYEEQIQELMAQARMAQNDTSLTTSYGKASKIVFENHKPTDTPFLMFLHGASFFVEALTLALVTIITMSLSLDRFRTTCQ